MNNPILIILSLATAVLIPVLFVDIKKIPKPLLIYLRIHLLLILGFLSVWLGGFAVPLFGKTYNYKTVPSPIKEKIEFFVLEAEKRNVNISKIEQTKIIYLPWSINTTFYEGACNIKENILYLPIKEVSTQTVIHELGHCLFGYEHYLDEKNSHEIMYYSNGKNQKLDERSLDFFFKEKPNPSLASKTTEKSMKLLMAFLNPFFLISAIIGGGILWYSLKTIYGLIRDYIKKDSK